MTKATPSATRTPNAKSSKPSSPYSSPKASPKIIAPQDLALESIAQLNTILNTLKKQNAQINNAKSGVDLVALLNEAMNEHAKAGTIAPTYAADHRVKAIRAEIRTQYELLIPLFSSLEREINSFNSDEINTRDALQQEQMNAFQALITSAEVPTALTEQTEAPTALTEQTEAPIAVAEHAEAPIAVAEHTETLTAVAEHTEAPAAAAEHTEAPAAVAEQTDAPTAVAEQTDDTSKMVEQAKVQAELETKLNELMLFIKLLNSKSVKNELTTNITVFKNELASTTAAKNFVTQCCNSIMNHKTELKMELPLIAKILNLLLDFCNTLGKLLGRKNNFFTPIQPKSDPNVAVIMDILKEISPQNFQPTSPSQ